jgi:hypothetical protein
MRFFSSSFFIIGTIPSSTTNSPDRIGVITYTNLTLTPILSANKIARSSAFFAHSLPSMPTK